MIRNKVSAFWLLIVCVFTLVTLNAAGSGNDCIDGEWYQSASSGCTPCGNCFDGLFCNKFSGRCPGPCEDWYYPVNECWGYIESFASYLTLAHIADGPEVKQQTHNSVEICFNQSSNLVRREDRKYYAYGIQYARATESAFLNHPDHIQVQDQLLIHKTISGLEINTDYKFRVVLLRVLSSNYQEEIDWSSTVLGSTTCDRPEVPEVLDLFILPSLTSLQLNYRIGETGCNSWDYTELQYRFLNESGYSKWHALKPDLSQATFYNFITGQTYVFKLTVQNDQSLESSAAELQLTFTEEALKDQDALVSGEEGGDDDEDDDDSVLIYVAIAIAAVASLIAIAAIVIAILVHKRAKKMEQSVSSRYLTPVSGVGLPPRTHAPPLPSIPIPEVARQPSKNRYEGLGSNREPSGVYDHLADPDYDNPDKGEQYLKVTA